MAAQNKAYAVPNGSLHGPSGVGAAVSLEQIVKPSLTILKSDCQVMAELVVTATSVGPDVPEYLVPATV